MRQSIFFLIKQYQRIGVFEGLQDLINRDGWDTYKISFVLLPSIVTKINATPIPINYLLKDYVTWASSSCGNFTIKFCYILLNPKTILELDFSWIRKLYCPNKIKYFFWQYLHNRIPYRAFLHHIGMNIDHKCPTC